MQYEQSNGGVLLTGCDSFDIRQTLECGQCFRFTQTGLNSYVIVANKRVLEISQRDDLVEFKPCTLQEFEDIWLNYFDLSTDYGAIKQTLRQNDAALADAVGYGDGIRILNQEKWETLISFIISQNKQIPMIKSIIKNLAAAYGEPITETEYAFPGPERLKDISSEELRRLKTGFRAEYIMDAIRKVAGGFDLDSLSKLETEQIKERLITIKGVGPKVANCVLLFAYGRREAFPVDVWVKRAVQEVYFEGRDTPQKDIVSLAENKFGSYGGYAQQYLFYYMREKKRCLVQ